MAKYISKQFRYLSGSDKNGDWVLREFSRKNEAFGFLKQSFNSHLDKMMHHEFEGLHEWNVDEIGLAITGFDISGHTTYFTCFYMEIENG